MMIEVALPDGWTAAQLLGCVEREIRMRDRTYPRLVERGQMSVAKMLEEQAAMRAIRFVLAQFPPTVPDQAQLFGWSK